MISNSFTRRKFFVRLTGLLSWFGIAGSMKGSSLSLRSSRVVDKEGISRSAEAIHQEVIFKASRKRVYEALTDAKQFDRVVQLSQARMSLGVKPTEISREVGGAFSLFGGHIQGRNIELIRDERLVQAWREATWKQGVYTLVRFELVEQGSETKLIFDQTGIVDGDSEHLAPGWKANYWEPLEKFLG